jgi:hypothetical protein
LCLTSGIKFKYLVDKMIQNLSNSVDYQKHKLILKTHHNPLNCSNSRATQLSNKN